MRMWIVGLVGMWAGLASGVDTAVAAGPYPFTGIFADGDASETADITAARCALAFFEQRDDGSYAYYHIDQKAYERSHKIGYLQYANGLCTYAPDSKIEVCTSKVDLSSPDDQTYSTFSVFTGIAPDTIQYSNYDTLGEAKAAIEIGRAHV